MILLIIVHNYIHNTCVDAVLVKSPQILSVNNSFLSVWFYTVKCHAVFLMLVAHHGKFVADQCAHSLRASGRLLRQSRLTSCSRVCDVIFGRAIKIMAANNVNQVIAALLIVLRRPRESRCYKASCRQLWWRQWIFRRPLYGTYHTLVREFEEEDLFSYV